MTKRSKEIDKEIEEFEASLDRIDKALDEGDYFTFLKEITKGVKYGN